MGRFDEIVERVIERKTKQIATYLETRFDIRPEKEQIRAMIQEALQSLAEGDLEAYEAQKAAFDQEYGAEKWGM